MENLLEVLVAGGLSADLLGQLAVGAVRLVAVLLSGPARHIEPSAS